MIYANVVHSNSFLLYFTGEKQAKTEDLKEMNDVSSGMASRIIQLYLQEILDCFLNHDDAVRLWAVKVVQIVLRQGLVHPVRMVPYLICLSTDTKLEVCIFIFIIKF